MISGHFIYKNFIVSQHPDVASKFKKLLIDLKPNRILEIGTADGGLTIILRDLLDDIGLSKTKIRTYDILEQKKLKEKNLSGIEIITKSPFNYPYSDLEYRDEIKDFIQLEGKTLVLCDGGSKKNEFRLLSEFLKIGDVIMAHDYAPNINYFNVHIKNKIWNWLEIEDSDIDKSCEKYNLKPYMEDDFISVVWACKKKLR